MGVNQSVVRLLSYVITVCETVEVWGLIKDNDYSNVAITTVCETVEVWGLIKV